MMQKIKNDYFIVDCWHNRVIYSNTLSKPISKWETLSNHVFGGHTVSTDGKFLVCDNTDKDEIALYKITGGGIVNIR